MTTGWTFFFFYFSFGSEGSGCCLLLRSFFLSENDFFFFFRQIDPDRNKRTLFASSNPWQNRLHGLQDAKD